MALRSIVVFGLTCLLASCASCTSGGGGGTLRANQVTVFEGTRWFDENCARGEASINCCTRHDAICPDFTNYDLMDVQVRGKRVAVLVLQNDNVRLMLSDDLAQTWREVTVGSPGNIAGFQSMRLHLAGDEVYLLVLRQTPVPLGFRTAAWPYRVDLTGGTGTHSANVELLSLGYGFSADDGTVHGVIITPEDARNGGGPCLAMYESWKPGSTNIERKQVVSRFTGCGIDMHVTASDDGRFFPVPMAAGDRACTVQYDVASNTLGGTCVPWGLWPAARDMNFVFSSYAGKRTQRLAAFSLDGGAWATPMTTAEWISLGTGVPTRNWTAASRPRFPGLISLGTKWVRVNDDRTVDEAVLPLGPCEDPTKSCFDRGSALTYHGEVGDVLWLEPLPDDEYLVFSMHDLSPGAWQFTPRITVSKEKATWKRVEPLPKPVTLGPAGYPNAQAAGLLEQWCLTRLSCGLGVNDFYNCLGAMQAGPQKPGLEAALRAAVGQGCASPALDATTFDCLQRGGVAVADGGCDFGVDLSSATCGTCTGDVFLNCPARAFDCAADGKPCASGGCGGCTPGCVGDRFQTCSNGTLTAVTRCDLLNMTCDATQPVPGWSPCIGKGTWSPSQTNQLLRCEGTYVLWHINGEKYADCTELGFSGCSSGRCTP
jgi:hypothetical protein